MARNEYQGKEETDKFDFGKKSVEEQKIISKDRISNENNAVPENENIAEEANKKIDQERSKHLH